MRENVSVSIIGCGRIARHHAKSIGDVDGLELVAVCDLDKHKAERFAQEFGCKAYSDYRKMLFELEQITLVVIATPSGMHFEHGYEVLADFRKNIVVEKPTVLRLDHIEKLACESRQNNLKFYPVFQNRFNRAVLRLKEALEGNELGKVQIVNVRVRWCRPQRYYDLSPWRGTYELDGGALTNQGVHHLDLLRYLFGEVSEVYAKMATYGSKIPVEDSVCGVFTMRSGAQGTLEITTAARPDDYEASISVVGSLGLAQIGGIAVNKLEIFTPDEGACPQYSEDFSRCVYGNGHTELYRQVRLDLLGEEAYSISVKDALGTISLLHSFYRSAEEKIAINPLEAKQSFRLGRGDDEKFNLYRTEDPNFAASENL